MIDETSKYTKTEIALIETYGEMIRLMDNLTRVKLIDDITDRPPSLLERKSISNKVLQKWLQWEQETKKIYESAYKLLPECKYLKCITHDVGGEVMFIHKQLKKA